MVEGEPGEHFYIIKDGEAVVHQAIPGSNQRRKVNHLFRADFFGERALLVSEPRIATVSVHTAGEGCGMVGSADSMGFKPTTWRNQQWLPHVVKAVVARHQTVVERRPRCITAQQRRCILIWICRRALHCMLC